MNLCALDPNVGKAHPDAGLLAVVRGQPRVAPRDLALDRHRALDRVDDAGEFREKGVVQTVDDAAAEAGDRGLAQEAALTVSVGREDRREAAQLHHDGMAPGFGTSAGQSGRAQMIC